MTESHTPHRVRRLLTAWVSALTGGERELVLEARGRPPTAKHRAAPRLPGQPPSGQLGSHSDASCEARRSPPHRTARRRKATRPRSHAR